MNDLVFSQIESIKILFTEEPEDGKCFKTVKFSVEFLSPIA